MGLLMAAAAAVDTQPSWGLVLRAHCCVPACSGGAAVACTALQVKQCTRLLQAQQCTGGRTPLLQAQQRTGGLHSAAAGAAMHWWPALAAAGAAMHWWPTLRRYTRGKAPVTLPVVLASAACCRPGQPGPWAAQVSHLQPVSGVRCSDASKAWLIYSSCRCNRSNERTCHSCRTCEFQCARRWPRTAHSKVQLALEGKAPAD